MSTGKPAGPGTRGLTGRTTVNLRWADMDALRHVTNVRYLEFLTEGLTAAGCIDDPRVAWPPRATVTFLRPIGLGESTIVVETSLGETQASQRLIPGPGSRLPDEPFATVQLGLTPSSPAPLPNRSRSLRTLRTRAADLGAGGAITLPRFFELIQEARVNLLEDIQRDGRIDLVVACIEVSTWSPLRPRAGTLAVDTHVSRVGRSSVDFRTTFAHDSTSPPSAVALTTFVAFDRDSQRARPLSQDERTAYIDAWHAGDHPPAL